MECADWIGVALGTAGSALVAVVLWLVLPRGVVLTKTRPIRCAGTGELLPDSTRLQNASAVPATIIGVDIVGPGPGGTRTLPLQGDSFEGVGLEFDDEDLENQRTEDGSDWVNVEVPPGETLTALVGNNVSLVVRYRRSGLWGWFERRSITIVGSA